MTQVELLVECPRCGLMGHHPFELRVFRTRTVSGRDGEPIEVSVFGDPPDGTPIIDRTCAFCGHSWIRPRLATI